MLHGIKVYMHFRVTGVCVCVCEWARRKSHDWDVSFQPICCSCRWERKRRQRRGQRKKVRTGSDLAVSIAVTTRKQKKKKRAEQERQTDRQTQRESSHLCVQPVPLLFGQPTFTFCTGRPFFSCPSVAWTSPSGRLVFFLKWSMLCPCVFETKENCIK